jgi:hypothetical protein
MKGAQPNMADPAWQPVQELLGHSKKEGNDA